MKKQITKIKNQRRNLIKRNKINKTIAFGKHIKKEKNMFIPDAIFYEEKAYEYELGKKLLNTYKKQNIPMVVIENHNNIEQMRKKQNKEFPYMKRNLIIATRKTHKYELQKAGCVVACIDYKQSGVGSNSCGPELLKQYRLDEEEFRWEMIFEFM